MKRIIKSSAIFAVIVAVIALIVAIFTTSYLNGAPTVVVNALSETGDIKEADKRPSEILEMLDEKKITDDMLENMYFSEQEFRRVIKKVDESEKLISNQITYEYYAEEWNCIDHDEDGGEIWGWRKGYKKKTIEDRKSVV